MSKSTNTRDSNFPAAVGRSGPRSLNSLSAQGTAYHSLSRTPSHESLNIAHPLLSTSPTTGVSPSSSTTNLNATAWDNGFSNPSGGTTTLGYVPYTPRHRPASSHLSHGHSPTSTSTSPSPSVLVTPATPATHIQNVVNRSPGIGGSHHPGDATAKLQLMSLKSAAQGLGLDVGSTGWGIVERLVGIVGSAGDESEEEEWREIWVTLSNGKATLVLPLDPLSSLGAHMPISRNDKERDRSRGTVINAQFISPEFVKNHVLFIDPSDRKENGLTQIVTLSGLRGFISPVDPTTQSASIFINSTLHPSTRSFKEISHLSTRAAGFASLLPQPSSSVSVSRYPTYTLPTHTKTFTLPPRSPFPPFDPNRKPPLPPRRPGSTPSTAAPVPQGPSIPSGSGGRLASLVSLFGRSGSSNNSSQLSSSPASTDGFVGAPGGSRPPSILSVSDKASIDEDAGTVPLSSSSLIVPAYSISTSIHTQVVLRGIWGGCCSDVTGALSSSSSSEGSSTPPLFSMPSLVIKRVLEFMDQGHVFPVLRIPTRSDSDSGGSLRSRRRKSGERDRYEVNGYGSEFWRDIEDVADRWQLFYADLEDEVRAASRKSEQKKPKSSKKKDREEVPVDESEKESLVSASVAASGSEKDVEEDEKRLLTAQEREEEEERRVREIMERVERVLCACCGLYGRLFPQPSPQCISPHPPSFADDTTETEATDSAHDEALASRIAALNLVDLGLSDLDIDTPTSKGHEEALFAVVKECGNTLSTLEGALSPKDKAAVLVKAHQALVDGLGKLPEPVHMKSEEEIVLAGDGKKEKISEPVTSDRAPILGGEEVMSPQSEEVSTTSALSAKPEKPRQQALSLDTLMPLLILSVVKANPPHLISHLLYTQRFRNRSFGGEEAYCLVNLMAVAEFIGALDPMTITSNRLGSEGDVSRTPGSGPIPIPAPTSRPGSRLSMVAQVPLPATPAGSVGSTSILSSTSFTLRHRVEQQVDALSNSANKVLTGVTGVVDTSFELFKSFTLPAIKVGSHQAEPYVPVETDGTVAPWNEGKQVLVRRDTGGFSIRGLKLPGLGGVSGGSGKAREEEMVSVSRPGSVRSRKSTGSRIAVSDYEDEDEDVDEKDDSEVDVDDHEGEEDSGSEDGEGEGGADREGEDYFSSGGGDARSIKSFESMMSSRRKNASRKGSEFGRSAKEVAGAARKSLSDRLAKVSGGIGGGSRTGSGSTKNPLQPDSPTAGSLLLSAQLPVSNRFDAPVSLSRPQSPTANPITLSLRLAPPKKRFLECTSADELRLKDVAELLKEYKRLVDGVRSVGGFAEEEDS